MLWTHLGNLDGVRAYFRAPTGPIFVKAVASKHMDPVCMYNQFWREKITLIAKELVAKSQQHVWK